MKIQLKVDAEVRGSALSAGQRVIVIDEVGAQLVSDGTGLQLPEDDLGAFVVLMPAE
jgi:hypothetical protein